MKLTVIAHPNSKKPRIEKDLFGTFHVYVNAPPLAGKANKAVIEALADYFQVKKNRVILVTGDRSKHKLVEVNID